jgi:hypothetical protein
MSIKNIIITQITNFIDELVNTYPNNNELVIFREKYSLLKNANSQLIINYFIKYIYPHKDVIKNEDEKFFLEGGGQEEINDKNGLKFRDNMKQLWNNNMTENNKKIVWKYFKTFILLIDKYIVENVGK